MKRLVLLLVAVAALLALPVAATAQQHSTAHWTVGLQADHQSVPVGDIITLTGTVKPHFTTVVLPSPPTGITPPNPGPAVMLPKTIDVLMSMYTGTVCSTSATLAPFGPIQAHLTLVGDYRFTFTVDTTGVAPGDYSFRATVADQLVRAASACVGVHIASVPGTPPAPRGEDGIFLCYSAFQVDPGVWPLSQAKTLLTQGYWLPFALAGNVVGGTNLGSHHLVCNVAAGQAAGLHFVDDGGYVTGVASHDALVGILGYYPLIAS